MRRKGAHLKSVPFRREVAPFLFVWGDALTCGHDRAQASFPSAQYFLSGVPARLLCRAADLDKAVRAAHTAFDLDASQVEAVVYGGTGR